MTNITPYSNRSLAIARSKTLPKYFTLDEAHAIIYTHTNNREVPEEKRRTMYNQRFLCWFLWHTGARISEALNVRISDLDVYTGVIHLETFKRKGHPMRSIPKSFEFFQELMLYVQINDFQSPGDRLFNITDRTARRWVEICCRRAGIIDDDRNHPHAFRHSFAVNCVLQGTPLVIIQKWMGHADITKTMIYLGVVEKDTRVHMDNLNF